MKIAIDYQSAQGQKTGIGVFATNLLEEFKRSNGGIEWVSYTARSERDLNTLGRVLWESVKIPSRTLRDRPDVVYSPGFAPAILSPVPQVVTVHDLIGMIYPRNLKPVARFYWQKWLPLCIRRAKTVVASSESTRRDIIRFLNIPKERIEVVPMGAMRCFRLLEDQSAIQAVRKQHVLTDPYFLSVGTLEPRKNIARLLEAFRIFKGQRSSPVKLAIVGKDGGERQTIEALRKELNLVQDVRLIGYMSDEDLVALTNGCLGYAFVSTYEGFGLPVLEAMKCQKSGVLADVSSLPEIGGETALYAKPDDVPGIAAQLAMFYENPTLREELAQKAFKRSQMFTWEKTARRMIEIFKRSV